MRYSGSCCHLADRTKEFVPPTMELGPHVAAPGVRFYTGQMFPGGYRSQVFIAEHGSQNRRTPNGYRIRLVIIQKNRVGRAGINHYKGF